MTSIVPGLLAKYAAAFPAGSVGPRFEQESCCSRPGGGCCETPRDLIPLGTL